MTENDLLKQELAKLNEQELANVHKALLVDDVANAIAALTTMVDDYGARPRSHADVLVYGCAILISKIAEVDLDALSAALSERGVS
jgi:hypothetical protein